MTNSLILLNALHPICKKPGLLGYQDACNETPVHIHPVIDQTGRTMAQSAADYQKGRNAQGVIINKSEVVSYARPGTSWHNYFLAIDFHLIVNGVDYWPATPEEALNNPNWMIVVKCFEKYGFNSGLYFPVRPGKDERDAPHVEYKGGTTISQLQAKYAAHDFIPGTTFVNI